MYVWKSSGIFPKLFKFHIQSRCLFCFLKSLSFLLTLLQSRTKIFQQFHDPTAAIKNDSSKIQSNITFSSMFSRQDFTPTAKGVSSRNTNKHYFHYQNHFPKPPFFRNGREIYSGNASIDHHATYY